MCIRPLNDSKGFSGEKPLWVGAGGQEICDKNIISLSLPDA